MDDKKAEKIQKLKYEISQESGLKFSKPSKRKRK
jgi:hypothetical protein